MSAHKARFFTILLLVTLISFLVPNLASMAQAPEMPYALGLVPSPAGDYPRLYLAQAVAPLPVSVDLSSGLPPVGNQGIQASCVGWAIAYYYRSYQEGVQDHRLPRQSTDLFSPAYIYNQRTTSDCTRDGGMSMVQGLRIAVDQGVASLSTMPYNASDSCTQPSAAAQAEAALHRAQSFLNIFSGRGTANLQTLKQHLATGDPFLLAVPVYSEFYGATSYNPVIGVPAQGSLFFGGHAVLVVGYDEVARTFKFVNSWGAGWAQSGYAYLTYDFVQQSAWEAWILTDTDTTPPTLPERAYELGGTESNVLQSQVNSPVFAWEASTDYGTTYSIYWGPDAQGTATLTQRQARFIPSPVSGTSTLYLRVKAQDPAGNSTSWRTLFVFRYEHKAGDDNDLALQPLQTGAGTTRLREGVVRPVGN